MKKIAFSLVILTLLISAYSCKKNTGNASKTAVEVQQPKDSMIVDNVLTQNEGKYPADFKLFEDSVMVNRLKKIVGESYAEIVKNFNVETPVVAENNIYKTTGCRQHDCSGYMTTILYDKTNDNLNVLVDKNGEVTVYDEKGKIDYTDSLKSK